MIDQLLTRLLAGLGAALCSGLLSFFGTGFTPVPALTWLAPLPVLLLAPRLSARHAAAAAFLAGVLGSTNNWAHSLHSTDVPLPMALGISAGMTVTLTTVVLLFRALVLLGLPLLATVAAMVGSTVSRWRVGAALGVVLVGVLGFGVIRLAGERGPSHQVALIAPNQGHWAVDVGTADGEKLVKAYADRIATLPEGVRLVVLPEGEFGVDDAGLASLVAPLASAARDRGADIVVGYIRRSGDARLNTALAISADGGEPTAYVRGQVRELVYAAGAGVGQSHDRRTHVGRRLQRLRQREPAPADQRVGRSEILRRCAVVDRWASSVLLQPALDVRDWKQRQQVVSFDGIHPAEAEHHAQLDVADAALSVDQSRELGLVPVDPFGERT
ncbi:MAG TPA: hypothetical protein VM306_04000 [Lentzea sp.]|nr:hypothetical protein [Lentzea sp.]HUQ54790.1 hypothetical protein [Lentzea sp.]